MVERRCRYCQQAFQPSKYQPKQAVCSSPECQRQRRSEDHRARVGRDPDYAESCRESTRKWRQRHPDYWKQYRESHPDSAERNRERQQARDCKRRLRKLANNTSASELKPCAATVWLLGPGLRQLANNNSVPANLWILQALAPKAPVRLPACQQQRSGAVAVFAG